MLYGIKAEFYTLLHLDNQIFSGYYPLNRLIGILVIGLNLYKLITNIPTSNYKKGAISANFS